MMDSFWTGSLTTATLWVPFASFFSWCTLEVTQWRSVMSRWWVNNGRFLLGGCYPFKPQETKLWSTHCWVLLESWVQVLTISTESNRWLGDISDEPHTRYWTPANLALSHRSLENTAVFWCLYFTIIMSSELRKPNDKCIIIKGDISQKFQNPFSVFKCYIWV